MAQVNIIIVDANERQQVGADLKRILWSDKLYDVALINGSFKGQRHFNRSSLRLVILVLPPIRKHAEKLLMELRSAPGQTPLLPVIDANVSTEELGDWIGWAEDFLVMPLRAAEVCARVRRLAGLEKPVLSRSAINETLEAQALAQLIGEDQEFVSLKRRIPSVARFESTVLLTGETGTGKERFARALHYSSRRAAKPFLAVNCGAIPLDLLESELYGHQKGAFTGAFAAQTGLVAEAERGTLFLDEIETLSLGSQVKLLRFLQDWTYYPIGSARVKQADVWIVASTNVELPTKIKEGTFREDLFYRLAVISLALPPLRQRKTDIPLLAAHFWKMYAPKAGRSREDLSAEVMDALCEHSWPGNVRELENVVQQLAVLTESNRVGLDDLRIPRASPRSDRSRISFAQKKAGVIEEFERSYITELLQLHQGNVTHAAQEARKDRRALGRLIKKYQITKR
ncbi:MAG TPA: sigma-54 dependent transcriptional regulator [Pyrinomonadaceae bacterium]|nr:sigma-54 dependent transcriptional regulator [Pyrinomonadaceae bacterium]